MRYIPKVDMPDCFENHSFLSSHNWNRFRNPCKREVKKNILEHEQQWLCGYCEIKVDIDSSHIEHIKPKSNPKYEELKFDYSNFIVSCNGKECRVDDENYDEDIHSCGHKKDNDFNENKFLDPTTTSDIGEYFVYDKFDGAVKSSSKDEQKARYMIELLNLDNVSLNKMRMNVVDGIRKSIEKLPNKKEILIDKVTSNNPPAFVSFVRYYYDI